VVSTGVGPGEISGAPAVAFSLVLDNGSAVPLSLDLTNVTVSYGPAETPGLPVDGPPGRPFSGVVAAGGSASAVYVFRIPTDERDRIMLSLSYRVDRPVVVFSGASS